MYQREKVRERQVVTPTSQTKGLGVVSVVPMGNWNANSLYKKLNIVRSHSASYIAKIDNVGIEPTITPNWQDVWQIVAYDGTGENVVVPDGNYPQMSVGQSTNDSNGNNIANQFNNISSQLNNIENNILEVTEDIENKVDKTQIVQEQGDSETLLMSQKALSILIQDIQTKLEFFSNNHVICVRFDNISPASIFGGTWVLIKDRMLLGAGGKYTLGSIDGSSTHSHTLSSKGGASMRLYSGFVYNGSVCSKPFNMPKYDTRGWAKQNSSQGDSFTLDIPEVPFKGIGLYGDTEDANVMPPFIAVNIWVRDDDNTIGGII